MLNFDPYQWLAENGGDESDSAPVVENAKSAALPATPATTATNWTEPPRITLARWHEKIVALDDDRPPDGFNRRRWLNFLDDAVYVYEGFASVAVRAGWDAADLFGCRPGVPHRGGLVDQLQGARSLKLDGPVAHWTSFGVRFRTCRGCGSGLRVVWDQPNG